MSAPTLRVVLAGLRHLDYDCSLPYGCLKAYAESRPALRGRVDVRIRPFRTSTPAESLAARILEEEPDVVGFSCYLWNAGLVAELTRLLKARRPGLRVVWGGPEATARPERALAENPAADFVAAGEGEQTFAALLEALLSPEPCFGKVDGLCWREGGTVRRNAPRRPLEDLNEIPSPFLSGDVPAEPEAYACFETDRGCPYDCRFCDWQNKQGVRTFGEARVLAETEALLSRNPRTRIFLCDADLLLDKERARRLLEGFRRLGAGRRPVWELHAYLPRLGLDEELARLLDSEQFTLAVGVQTTNPRSLKAVRRFFDEEKTRENAALLRRLAPRAKINLQLIFGLPGDDLEGFERSLDFVLSLWPDTVMLFPALALPGSDMGDQPAEYGLRAQLGPPYRVLSSDTFPEEDLRAADALAFRNFTFQGAGFVARTLRYLGACLEGRVERGYVAALEGFSRALSGTPLDLEPLYRQARRDPLGFVTFREEPWGHDFLKRHGPELLDRLAAFAEALLEEHGRGDAWPELEAYLANEREAAAWKELLRTKSFHQLLSRLIGTGGAEGALWVGCEESASAETFWPAEARRHWVSPLVKFDEGCPAARHFRLQDLRQGVERAVLGAEAAGYSRVVLSRFCRWLSREERRALFSALRYRADRGGRGARLVLFDSCAPPTRLERDRCWAPALERSPALVAAGAPARAGAPAPEPPQTSEGLAADLRAAGWSDVRDIPLNLGGRRAVLLSAEAA